MIKQRDLLLVPFPFSDQSGRKVRPVIILSNDKFNKHSQDVVVTGVTSNVSEDKYSLDLNNKDLEQGRLTTRCVVKVENILKLDKNLIIKKIGKIKKEKLEKIIEILYSIFNLEN